MPRKSAARRSSSRSRSTPSTRTPTPFQADQPIRLQRLLAAAGFGSRRQCEDLIQEGRVTVDDQVVTKLGTSVTPHDHKVAVDGVLLRKRKLVCYAVNKPAGVVTTNRDPQGRPRVVDLVPPDERVFPVGRLDRNSEGLILLTNDGDLAQRLTHPKFGVRKVYRVTVAGKVDPETMKQMRRGIHLAEGLVRVDGAKLLKSRSRATEMEIILREGKNREIRRILARLGHKVQHLRRIAVGPLRLGDLPSGAYRIVRPHEVEKLWKSTESSSAETGPPRKRTGKGAAKKKAGRPSSSGKGKVPKHASGRASGTPSKSVAKGKRSAASARQTRQFDLGGAPTRGAVIGGDDSNSGSESSSQSRGRKKVVKKAGRPGGSGAAGKRRGRPASNPRRKRGK